MHGKFLLPTHETAMDPNIYADKSSLVLEWLLLVAVEKKYFTIREVARDQGVSVGLVQRIFGVLTSKGYLQISGLRTGKKFILKKPQLLLNSWLESYNIIKKCKMWTYRTGLQGRQQILEVLMQSGFQQKVVLALHSATEAHHCKNTNLDTLELYLLDPDLRSQIEETLQLEPQEKGYEVLLIEPYYKKMLQQSLRNHLLYSPPLLTFLDLFHFPLRGREQAEFMAERMTALKKIYKKVK